MLSLQKRLANRSNSLRSTGPRSSEGKAVVALNSVKGGLFSRALVVPATGETAEAFDAFAGAVVNDLDPVGMIEGELAVRVAGVLWRLRRVVRHEAAALSQVRVKLPPHPDEVTIESIELGIPLPPGARTATRLAYVRARIRRGRPGGEKYRAAAQVLTGLGTRGGDERVPEPDSLAAAVWQALRRPMDPVAFGTFLSKYTIAGSVGTVAAVQTLVAGASSETGRDPTEIVAATLGVLGEWAAEGDAVRDQLVTEERNLTAQLLAERERAALAGTLTDEKLLERVARAETHLSRELDRVLVQLERMRGLRSGRTTTVVATVTRTAVGGFALQSGGGNKRLTDPVDGHGVAHQERVAEQRDSVG